MTAPGTILEIPDGSPWRVVLDTNVVLDLLHFRDPEVAGLDEALREGRVRPLVSAACLAELQRVLTYPEFRLDERQAAALFKAYAEAAELVVVSEEGVARLPHCSDPDDQKFLELTQQAGAQYLVTRDKALLRLSRTLLRSGRFAIVTPARMRDVLQSSMARRLGPESSAAGPSSSMDQTTLR